MSQSEVLNLLEKYKKPLSCSEISELLNIISPTERFMIDRAVRKLLIHKEIKVIEIDRFQAKERFGKNAPFRRLRLYYV